MKVKRLLRFYFYAESLEKAIDNLIIKTACESGGRDGVEVAERVCMLIGEKSALGSFWDYLDGVISVLPEADKQSLAEYASLRAGVRPQEEKQKRIKRAVIKFTRRSRRVRSFLKEAQLVGKYYCLLTV